MKKSFVKELLLYNAILFACFLLQFSIEKAFLSEMFYSIFAIYSFHFLLTNSICLAVYYISKKENTFTGYAFLAGTILQMLASILFLLPLIQAKISEPMLSLFAFMFPYFISLLLIVVCSVRRLSAK